jgi:hypothetical protein
LVGCLLARLLEWLCGLCLVLGDWLVGWLVSWSVGVWSCSWFIGWWLMIGPLVN